MVSRGSQLVGVEEAQNTESKLYWAGVWHPHRESTTTMRAEIVAHMIYLEGLEYLEYVVHFFS